MNKKPRVLEVDGHSLIKEGDPYNLFWIKYEHPDSKIGHKTVFMTPESFGKLMMLYDAHLEYLKKFEPEKIYGGVNNETTGQ